MADDTGLVGLDPYELQDVECRRLAAHFESLEPGEWQLASGCEGWSRHDLLAHLVAIEAYFSACLSGSVKALMQTYIDQGATSLAEFNAAGVAAGVDIASSELLDKWRTHNEQNRAGYRAADGTDIDSSIGTYPGRLQAFHAAFEYGIHANDVDAPVGHDEFDGRQNWLAGIAHFALTEVKPTAVVDVAGGTYTVTIDDTSASFDRDTFVAEVAGRTLPTSSTASPEDLALLSLGY